MIYSHDTWIYIDEIVLKIFVDEFQLCIYSWNSFFFFFKYFSPCLFVNLHVSSRDYPVLRCKQLIKNDNGNHRAERDFPFDRYDRTCSKTRFACNRSSSLGSLMNFSSSFFFPPRPFKVTERCFTNVFKNWLSGTCYTANSNG